MKHFNVKILLKLVVTLALVVFYSCQNDKAADHQAALPHNNMKEGSQLDESETAELAGATGKSAALISPADLEEMLLEDTTAVTIVNFWRHNCSPCLDIQQHLQTIQSQDGNGKLNVISLNLDPQTEVEKVNFYIRSHGISTDVFQLLKKSDLMSLEITPDWNGQFPALAILTEGELQAFYQQDFSENELRAILNPYFMMTDD